MADWTAARLPLLNSATASVVRIVFTTLLSAPVNTGNRTSRGCTTVVTSAGA